MLLILSLSLLPLGLIAILVSVQSARQKNVDRRDETLARLEIKAQRLDAALARTIITIHTASTAISLSPPASPLCGTMLRRLEQEPVPARYLLFAGGKARCASAGFAPPLPAPDSPGQRFRAEIAPDGKTLRLIVFGDDGQPQGISDYGRDALAQAHRPSRHQPASSTST